MALHSLSSLPHSKFLPSPPFFPSYQKIVEKISLLMLLLLLL